MERQRKVFNGIWIQRFWIKKIILITPLALSECINRICEKKGNDKWHNLFYLCNQINKNKHRIIIQGSISAIDKINKKTDIYSHDLSFFKQYNVSKVLVESQFYSWVINNTYPHIEFVLTEPGLTSTGIITSFNPVIRFLGKWFLRFFFHSTKKASLTLFKGTCLDVKNGDFIVPRGLFTLSGYPKKKKFPLRRYQKEILDQVK